MTQRSIEDNNRRCGPQKCPMTQTSKVEDFSGRNSGQKQKEGEIGATLLTSGLWNEASGREMGHL